MTNNVKQPRKPQLERNIQVAIGRSQDTVIINFNRPVQWVGLTVQQARTIADEIVRNIESIVGRG